MPHLGGATADMLRIALPDGRRRMLHVREAARLQSFPDWFLLRGQSLRADGADWERCASTARAGACTTGDEGIGETDNGKTETIVRRSFGYDT